MAIRVTFKPRGKRTIRAVHRGTTRARVLEALAKPEGTSIDELSTMLGWSRAPVIVMLRTDVSGACGYGVTYNTKTQRLFLRYPRRMAGVLYK